MAGKLFSEKISFSGLLVSLSLIYLVFWFPQPIRLAVFFVYSYVCYWLMAFVIKPKLKVFGVLAVCLPMILVKFDIREGAFFLNDLLAVAGLSYMSFRTASLYFDTLPSDRPVSFHKFVLYLIFPPTLLIGPIDRFNRFNGDLIQGYRNIHRQRWLQGGFELLIGFVYSYVFAEIVQRYWLSNIDSTSVNIPDMFYTMYAYSIFLYFDFAGYSSMAIGLGRLMGIDVPINFNQPWKATNPQEFWRRFHKSLGDWLNDYFFKPLYFWLSRKNLFKKSSLTRQNIALFSTFLLMGCWNGFQVHFILSGAIFGLYSVLYNIYQTRCKQRKKDIVFGSLNPLLVRLLSFIIFWHGAAFALYIFSGRFPFL